MECCYGAQPFLHLGDHTILSCCGVQQSDPLGPLGFALSLHPLVTKIKAQLPGLLINVWYLDDGVLCGSPEDLLAALRIIESDGPAQGLHLNRSKSLLHIPEGSLSVSNPLPPEIPICREGFTLLGSPIGSTSYCETTVLKCVKKVSEVLARLPDLQDSQMEAALLCSCLALPKLNCVLRTCPPHKINGAIIFFDNAMRDALSELAGAPLNDWAWLKATLPNSLGGLTIREACLHAPAAFVSSLVQSSHLVLRILGRSPDTSPHLAPTVAALAKVTGNPDWHSLDDIDIPL